jgi:hypothetical protein
MKRVILGSVLVVVGVLFAVRPMDWIELRYHVDPDGDSGAMEFIVSAVLVAGGAIVLGSAWWSRVRFADARRRRDAPGGAMTSGDGPQTTIPGN